MSKMVRESGKSADQIARMRDMDISELIPKNTMSNITFMVNKFKELGAMLLGKIATASQGLDFSGITDWAEKLVDSWIPSIVAFFENTPATIQGMKDEANAFWESIKGWAKTLALVLIAIKLLPLGLSLLGSTVLPLVGVGFQGMGVGARFAGRGLASMAAAGSAAIPLLLTIALVGASVALIFASIGYVLSKLPPVIDSIASGFVLVAQAITGSLLKLATPEMVLGIMGLAGAFWMLAGALVAVGVAGLVAAPGLAVVAGFTAAMYALGKAGNANDKQSETELIKNELQTLNIAVIKLIENFDKKYIPAIVASNIEGAKGAGKSLGRQLAGI
jgi:hypothetical protein